MITIQYENYQYGKIDGAIATMNSLLNQRKGSPADQKKWAEVVKKLNKTKQSIKNAYAEAPEEFKIAHPDIKELTIRMMQDHGATVFAERNNVASTTLVERLASQPNARTVFTNGLIGFAVADLAVASFTSLIGTKMGVLDLIGKGLVSINPTTAAATAGPIISAIGNAVKFFWGLSPAFVLIGAGYLAMKVVPSIKNFFSKIQHARAEREMINEKLANIAGHTKTSDGSSQYWSNGYKEPLVEGVEFDNSGSNTPDNYTSNNDKPEQTKPLTLEEQREHVKNISQNLYKTEKDIESINEKLQNKLDAYQKSPNASLMSDISNLRSQLDELKVQQGKLKQEYKGNISSLKTGHPLTEKAIRFLESTKKAAGAKFDRDALRKATLSLNALSYYEAQEIADLCRQAASTTDRAAKIKLRDKIADLSEKLAKKSGGVASYITELIEKEVANFKEMPNNGGSDMYTTEPIIDPNDPDAEFIRELLSYSGDGTNDNELIAELFGYAGEKDKIRTDFQRRRQEILNGNDPKVKQSSVVPPESPEQSTLPQQPAQPKPIAKPLTPTAIETGELNPKQVKVLKQVLLFQQDNRLNNTKSGAITEYGLRNVLRDINRNGHLYDMPLDAESQEYASYIINSLLVDREKELNKKHTTSKTRDKLVELGIIDANTRDQIEKM